MASESSRQAASRPAPVPQTRFHVQGLQILQGDTEARKGLAGQVDSAGVHGVLAQLAAQHVLRRQVVDELRVGLIVRLGRPGSTLGQGSRTVTARVQ